MDTFIFRPAEAGAFSDFKLIEEIPGESQYDPRMIWGTNGTAMTDGSGAPNMWDQSPIYFVSDFDIG